MLMPIAVLIMIIVYYIDIKAKDEKRGVEKMEKSASELASQIMQKAIEISDNTKHDVCAYYYGHTKAIDVDIYKNGWREDVEAVNLKTYLDMEGCIDDLQNILKELEELEEN